jgi:hypothetical protein
MEEFSDLLKQSGNGMDIHKVDRDSTGREKYIKLYYTLNN